MATAEYARPWASVATSTRACQLSVGSPNEGWAIQTLSKSQRLSGGFALSQKKLVGVSAVPYVTEQPRADLAAVIVGIEVGRGVRVAHQRAASCSDGYTVGRKRIAQNRHANGNEPAAVEKAREWHCLCAYRKVAGVESHEIQTPDQAKSQPALSVIRHATTQLEVTRELSYAGYRSLWATLGLAWARGRSTAVVEVARNRYRPATAGSS